MFIIIPVRRRYTIYYCPRCKARQRFFSWIPIRTPDWTCRRCGRKFQINASCFATNWAYGFALWGMPLTGIISGLCLALAVMAARFPAGTSVVKRLTSVALSFVFGLPLGAVVGVIPCLILGYFVGLIYGASAINRRGSKPERSRPRRQKRPVEPDSD